MRYRPLKLPLVPESQQLTANLLADPVTPSAGALIGTPGSYPSLARRSRIVPNAHFSFATPLTLPFPYDLGIGNVSAQDRAEMIEKELCKFEPQLNGLGRGRTDASFPSARLVAFSPETHAQRIAHLDVGDSYEWIKHTSGSAGVYSSGPKVDAQGTAGLPNDCGDSADARRAFSDWASGRSVRIETSGEPEGTGTQFVHADGQIKAERVTSPGYGPWALRYGGHQFGSWADQLGDGRTVSLVETTAPDGERVEVQLKGAGRTPYSRFGDGLATLKSSMREFLVSEYMAALDIPSSRSLCVAALPDVVVEREEPNTAAVNMRLARSWLRIGNFEIHAAHNEWESLRILGEYAARHIFGWEDVAIGESTARRAPWAARLARRVAESNAITVARWQVYGFMHGVMNTDNIALSGETIDYGPYGFMDLFDEDCICNHTDFTGRYSYRMQPTMVLFAIDKLIDALAPVIGFEIVHERAPAPGELSGASQADVAEWTDAADSTREPISAAARDILLAEWETLWASRLGLCKAEKALIDQLLIAITSLDMSRFLRGLCAVPTQLAEGAEIRDVAQALVDGAAHESSDTGPSRVDLVSNWLSTYAERLRHDGRDAVAVGAEMRVRNPRFVLRNWITDEAAAGLEKSDTAFLDHIRVMCTRPFDDWNDDEVRT